MTQPELEAPNLERQAACSGSPTPPSHTRNKLALFLFALYGLAFVAYLAPYYNWWYRLAVDLLRAVLLLTFLCFIVCALVRHIRTRHLKGIFSLASLAFWVLITAYHVPVWRYAITDSYLQAHTCPPAKYLEDESILGDIVEIKVDGVGGTGAFENGSFCRFVVCNVEFYYCEHGRALGSRNQPVGLGSFSPVRSGPGRP